MLGFALGRTYVHSIVRDIMRDAYAELASPDPICGSSTAKAVGRRAVVFIHTEAIAMALPLTSSCQCGHPTAR
jgi:hypothetical protein